MDNSGTLTLKQVDAIIEQLTQGPHDDAGKIRAEQLLETWRKARELVIDHEFRLLTLTEMRRLVRDSKTRKDGIATKKVLRHAMKLQPQQTAAMLKKWRCLQIIFTESELDEMYASHREERREQARLELQRLFDLGEG